MTSARPASRRQPKTRAGLGATLAALLLGAGAQTGCANAPVTDAASHATPTAAAAPAPTASTAVRTPASASPASRTAQAAPAPAEPGTSGPSGTARTAEVQVAAAVPRPSAMDAPLFYQVLVGELELRAGRAGAAFEVMLDAARRQGDDALFQRAVQIALQGRSAEQALAAAEAWRERRPGHVAPLRYQTQIHLALGQGEEAAEAFGQWLQNLPKAQRPALIASLPQLFQRLPDAKASVALAERALTESLGDPATQLPARIALAQMKARAGQHAEALAVARMAQVQDPGSTGAALLALQLMDKDPAAEDLVRRYLARPKADINLRLGYVRALMQANRLSEAREQLDVITRAEPQRAEPWLMLGAMQVELRDPVAGEASLNRYMDLAVMPAGTPQDPAASAEAADASEDPKDSDEPPTSAPPDPATRQRMAMMRAAGLNQARMLLSQAAEQRGDLPAAEQWLTQVNDPRRELEVATRKATLMARQGRLEEGRALLRALPERDNGDERAKLLAEVQVLRELQRWEEAAALLDTGIQAKPDDVDLLYEMAMIDDKLGHYAEMERRLWRVIALKPDHPHAHNALGYSLADRNIRLDEAQELVQRALTMSPGDPFITDSLGWVAFRQGRLDDAIRTLRQAYASRPDPEIAAHLGEALWAAGQRDEALKIWRQGLDRAPDNAVLLETVRRLDAKP